MNENFERLSMKALYFALLILPFASSPSFAATKTTVPTLTCRADTAANFVNTCAPDMVLRVAMKDGTNLDELNLANFLSLTLFDSGVVKIVTPGNPSSKSVSYLGTTKASATDGVSKRLAIQFSSWPNSSAVGVSQMLSKGSPAAEFPSNVFFNFSPEANIQNNCKSDVTSAADAPVLLCPVVSKSTSPNLVISAVAPNEFLGLPSPKSGSLGKLSLINKPVPLFLTGFGVAVNNNLYKAIQQDNIAKGLISASCTLGDKANAACQPSLKSSYISSLLSTQGSVKSSSDLFAGDHNPIFVNTYSKASSTQAATGIMFLNNPCGSFTTPGNSSPNNLDFVGNNNSSPRFVVQSQTSHDEVVNWLNGSTGYAVGVLPLSISPLSTDNWSYIRIDGQSPNFSATGIPDTKNRIGISSGNYRFATTSFALTLAGSSPSPLNSPINELVKGLQNISNTDLTGVAYLDGANSDLTGKQSAVSRAQSNNCSPLITINKGLAFLLASNSSFGPEDTQCKSTKYVDGSNIQICSKALNNSVSWSADHITKTTTYTFQDGSKNIVPANIAPVVKTTYLNDTQTVTTTYGDGTVNASVNKSVSSSDNWGIDHVTKTTTWTFADKTTNNTTTIVPAVQVGTPTYNAGVQSVKVHYSDNSPDVVQTNTGSPSVSFSPDGSTKTTTWTFPDRTTNQVTEKALSSTSANFIYTPDSYTKTVTYSFANSVKNSVVKTVPSNSKSVAYSGNKESTSVVYQDLTTAVINATASTSSSITLENGSKVTRYFFDDGTFNDVLAN